jgi:hypothetical protein
VPASPRTRSRWVTDRRQLRNGAWGYIVGTDKDAGPNNQRLYLNGARVAEMIDTLPIDLIDRVVALIMAIGCSRPVAAAAGHVPAVPV